MNRIAKRMATGVALLLAAGAAALAWDARDVHGDLRRSVEVRLAGEAPRVLVKGAGVGMDYDEVLRAWNIEGFFGRRGPIVAQATGDFGTKLSLVASFDDGGRMSQVTYAFEGNPLALWRVARRWREALEPIASESAGSYTVWRDGDGRVARMGWNGSFPPGLTVTFGE